VYALVQQRLWLVSAAVSCGQGGGGGGGDVQLARVMEERNKTHKYRVIGRVVGHVVVDDDGCCARR
jgi:hypothetical protein